MIKKDKKINLLFDISVLSNGAQMSTARSGVFFVAYNILLEMLQRDNLNIKFYCSPKQKHLVNDVINSDNNLKDVQIFEYSRLYNLVSYFEYLKYENKKNKGNKINRVCIKSILNILKFILQAKNKFGFYKKLFKNTEVFFSPWGLIPNEIKSINHIRKYIVIHDCIPLIFPENFSDMAKKSSELYKQFHSFDKNIHYFTNSEYTKADFIKYTKCKNVTVIKLSTGLSYKKTKDATQINIVKTKYNIPPDKKYLFSLCSLEPRKNMIFAVKNFIEFIKRNNIDDFVFVLGGGHWDNLIEKLNAKIEDLKKYKAKIIKIGYVADNDMEALYSGAEMFIFPSIYEGFGMPVLEAMKCGCPVICSNVTSIPEVIGDCGIQINPKDDEALITAFEKMYFDGNFREECISKGLQRAKMFTWENCVDVIIEKISNA